jgi:hypothetical protein
LIEFLYGIWDSIAPLKNDYIDFYVKMAKEERSNILKQLTYSRKSAKQCQTDQNRMEKKNSRLISCTKAHDEKINNIMDGDVTFLKGDQYQTVPNNCYGEQIGSAYQTPLTDNWFCCLGSEESQQEEYQFDF